MVCVCCDLCALCGITITETFLYVDRELIKQHVRQARLVLVYLPPHRLNWLLSASCFARRALPISSTSTIAVFIAAAWK